MPPDCLSKCIEGRMLTMPSEKSKNGTFFLKISLLICSFCMPLFVVELASRVVKGEYSTNNFLREKRSLFLSAYPSQHDVQLGWVPRKGKNLGDNVWGTRVTINDDGLRTNGENSLAEILGFLH